LADRTACPVPFVVPLLTLGLGAFACDDGAPPSPASSGDAASAAVVASSPAEADPRAVPVAAPDGAASAEDGTSGAAAEGATSGDGFWSQASTLEERAANVRRALAAAGDGPVHLDIHDLGGWEFDENAEQPFPEYVLALDGRRVVLRGFMLPDVDFENIRTFHLVRSLWACCFGAPPGPNEVVRVTLVEGDGIDYTYQTLEVEGTFHVVFEMTDGLLDDLYRLDADRAVELGFDDPLAPASVSPEERRKLGEFVGTDVEF